MITIINDNDTADPQIMMVIVMMITTSTTTITTIKRSVAMIRLLAARAPCGGEGAAPATPRASPRGAPGAGRAASAASPPLTRASLLSKLDELRGRAKGVDAAAAAAPPCAAPGTPPGTE